MQRLKAAQEEENKCKWVPTYKEDIDSTLCKAQATSQKKVLTHRKARQQRKGLWNAVFRACTHDLRENRAAPTEPAHDKAWQQSIMGQEVIMRHYSMLLKY